MNWLRYTAAEVLTQSDEAGNRLITLLAKDYKEMMGTDLCQSCKDFGSKYEAFLSELKNKTSSKYRLKAMYDGIPLDFGSSIYVRNANMTDELAKKLIETHPRGEDLFETLPKK